MKEHSIPRNKEKHTRRPRNGIGIGEKDRKVCNSNILLSVLICASFPVLVVTRLSSDKEKQKVAMGYFVPSTHCRFEVSHECIFAGNYL